MPQTSSLLRRPWHPASPGNIFSVLFRVEDFRRILVFFQGFRGCEDRVVVALQAVYGKVQGICICPCRSNSEPKFLNLKTPKP
jgi:hypothetical protein